MLFVKGSVTDAGAVFDDSYVYQACAPGVQSPHLTIEFGASPAQT